ncbi:MAG: UvrD-helicase domain-containing protein [Alphaproteobacteria bacterium]
MNQQLNLTTAQRQAIDSHYYVWVSASAGSGKTKVLIDRLLYLLLSGQRPRDLLVITFTRAAAAEIKNRLDKKLAEWTALPIDALEKDIKNIGGNQWRDSDLHEKITIARGLFLQIMDEKQNLTINTIHGFCQQLLNYFPLEADVPFGFRLAEENLAKDLLKNAIDTTLLRQDTIIKNLLTEARRYWQNDSQLRDMVAIILRDPLRLEHYQTMGYHKKKFWQKHYDWLAKEQITALETSIKQKIDDKAEDYFLTKQKQPKKKLKNNPTDMASAEYMAHQYNKMDRAEAAGKSYVALGLAIEILNHYKKIKFVHGLLDYDDLITKAGDLLTDKKNIHPWVQYKMAKAIKHILLDEAQDTNPHQWRVIKTLIDGFAIMQKTLGDHGFLIVGDAKQSIFQFQGADIASYQNYQQIWQTQFTNQFRNLSFDISFRSGKHILQFVDTIFTNEKFLSPFGKALSHKPHFAKMPSKVIVRKFITYDNKNKKQNKQNYINQLVDDIKYHINHSSIVENGIPRPIAAADMMVLVRERKNLQPPLVAALKKNGIAVAGRDRIVLRDEWLVKDLINLGQFALMPRADFYLANLLVSPFCGLTYHELESFALGRNGSLYQALSHYAEKTTNPWWKKLLNWLDDIHHLAFQKTAFEFFYSILQKPCPYRINNLSFITTARSILLGCWGSGEAETLHIFFDRLLTLEHNQTNQLSMVIDHLLKDESDIKKDIANTKNTGVRIITCHGAKGLESPIIFLPDDISHAGVQKETYFIEDKQHSHPPFFIKKQKINNYKPPHLELLQEKEKSAEEESYRLLYVALTRAKNLLIISGFGKNQDDTSAPYKHSWYNLCKKAMMTLPYQNIENGWEFGDDMPKQKTATPLKHPPPDILNDNDHWLKKEIHFSALKSNPTADSHDRIFSINDKNITRGLAVHRLLELLTPAITDNIIEQGKKILGREFPKLTMADQEIYLNEVLAILSPNKNPLPMDWQELFITNPTNQYFDKKLLLEQEVMGMIDDEIITGRIDRMLVSDNEVKIIDYKSSTHLIKNISQVPTNYKKQMQHYQKLLSATYPDKKIRTALLFTHGFHLIEIT